MLPKAWTQPEEPHLRKPCLHLQIQLGFLKLFRDGASSAVLTPLPFPQEMASLQREGLQARILSSEEEEKLKRDQVLVSDFKQQKLEKEAQKNWDLFYKRNSTNFFKDRHWTTREFEELRSCREVMLHLIWAVLHLKYVEEECFLAFLWKCEVENLWSLVRMLCTLEILCLVSSSFSSSWVV